MGCSAPVEDAHVCGAVVRRRCCGGPGLLQVTVHHDWSGQTAGGRTCSVRQGSVGEGKRDPLEKAKGPARAHLTLRGRWLRGPRAAAAGQQSMHSSRRHSVHWYAHGCSSRKSLMASLRARLGTACSTRCSGLREIGSKPAWSGLGVRGWGWGWVEARLVRVRGWGWGWVEAHLLGVRVRGWGWGWVEAHLVRVRGWGWGLGTGWGWGSGQGQGQG